MLLPTGNYGVLTHKDMLVDGKIGATYLREWLAERDLEAESIQGAVINYDNDWYWFVASEVHEIDNSGNDWTGDGEIEFID